MEEREEVQVRATADRFLAEDWALALVAMALSPRVRRTAEGYIVSVPEPELRRARAGLAAYDLENAAHRSGGDEQVFPVRLRSGAAIGGMLLIFFFITILSDPAVPWLERGSAHAGRIFSGELWRAVTALTLHADVVHALSNAVAAAVFAGALNGLLGVGLGSVLLVAAGAGGNLVNALLQGPPHVSVGASTAIFAAVGMVGALGRATLRRSEVSRRRAWLPLAAALALLAMLGAGGPRVDLLAHLLGFLFGCMFGLVSGLALQRPPAAATQWTLGCVALGLLVGCWTLALR